MALYDHGSVASQIPKPISEGGTGSTTAAGAIDNLLPSQTGNSGKFLTTDGTDPSWASAGGGSGTVTSVDTSGGTTGLTFSGGPITTSGTMTAAGTLIGANGGTGVANTGKTITLGGNLTTSGAFPTTVTVTGTTTVTLPASGTLATLAGAETFSNKILTGLSGTVTVGANNSYDLGSSGVKFRTIYAQTSFVADGNFQSNSGGLVFAGAALTNPSGVICRFTNSGATAIGAVASGRLVSNKTANYSVVFTDSDAFFTNAGATGTVVFSLPVAVANMRYNFYVDASQTVQVNASTSATIQVAGSVSASAGNVTSNVVGSCLSLQAISATKWVASDVVGSWVVT